MVTFKSIRARLTAAFSLSLAVLMIAAIFGLIWYANRSAQRSADSVLMAAAKSVVLEYSSPHKSYNPAGLIEEEREDLRGSNLAISITDSGGHVLGKSQKNAPGLSPVDGGNWRVLTAKLKNGDIVVVGMPWAKTRGALRYHAIALIWLGLFVVVITSVGAWLLVGRTLTPISVLVGQAKASSADNLAISLEPPSQDYEMVELVDTLNGLLCRITETAAAKGRFYSAASHELRTPLQALSGHLELALNRDRTTDEYKVVVGEAYEQARRLISLVRALLFLYQLDSSTMLPPKEPIDLVDVCRRSLSHFQPVIEERGLKVHVRTPAEVDILAPPNHIDMLVRNLVENAAKYASEHGQVNLAILVEANVVRLEVVNDCAVASNWKSGELFEPFSRPDSSRNSKTGGTGLGLAICKSIADANGWQLDTWSESESVRTVLIITRCSDAV